MAQLIFENNVTSPSAPALGKVTLFAKSDSSLWIKFPTGEEYPLVTSAGVEVLIDSLRPFSDSMPLMNGVASQGVDDNISRDDHVHPSDTTKADLSHVNSQDAALAADITNLDNEVQTLDAYNVKKTSNTGSAKLPAGTEAQRDPSPQVGAIRFSSTQTGWEGWNGVNWVSIGGGQMLGQALIKGIFYNAITIAENVTVKAGTNGLSAGEIQVDNGFEVTVENGSTWSVV